MDVEVERPHVHHSTGHRWIDLIVPIAALFVSLISILIAYHHGEVMKELVDQNARLVQANSMPYLELNNNRTMAEPGTPGQPRVYFSAINRGVGPAEVRSVRVTIDGRPVESSRQLVESCCGPLSRPIGTSTLSGRMIQPGQEIRYLDIAVTPESRVQAEALFKAFLDRRVVTAVCYCSVFEECWTLLSSDEKPPQRVEQCPAGELQYRD